MSKNILVMLDFEHNKVVIKRTNKCEDDVRLSLLNSDNLFMLGEDIKLEVKL